MTDRKTTEEIARAIRTYYAGHPIMTDEEYEELVASSGLGWKDIENLKTQNVQVIDKVRHLHPMTSLPKVKTQGDIPEKSPNLDRMYQLKLDGSSLEVHYDSHGHFDWAATRGDYEIGDNRTNLARTLIGMGRIPWSYIPNVAVRGELVVSNADWPAISQEFANQRNASAGISNRNDVQYARFLTFIAYDVIEDESGDSIMVDADLWGEVTYGGGDSSPVGPTYECLTLGSFFTFEDAQHAFEHSYFPVDGVVIKDYDDMTERSAVAYKFSDRTYETVIRDVRWQIGKSGKLTPVAEFDPVFIDAEVRRASLGSYALFRDLDLHYGDHILVKKSNMVIPQVVTNVYGGGSDLISAPKYYNGHPTQVIGQHLYTENDIAWRQRLIMQVNDVAGKGIGPAFVERCIDAYGVQDIYDLILAVRDESFSIEGIGDKTLETARAALEMVGDIDMVQFIASIHIDGIGQVQSSKIAAKIAAVAESEHREQWDVLRRISRPYEFAFAIEGIGDVIARSFRTSFDLIRRQLDGFAEAFHHYPANYEPSSSKISSGAAQVVLTGKMDVSRNEATRELEADGYSVVGKVTKDTSFLILCGDRESSKVKDAERLGVRIIRCSDLNDALNQLKEVQK